MPDFSLERNCSGLVCGVDEAGRGPLAGPVVAAAVMFFNMEAPSGIDDSKRLKPATRDYLFDAISASALVGVGMASVEEIDAHNILAATMLAMQRAVENLPQIPDFALIDGNRTPMLPCKAKAVVAGDSKSLSVAAASIIAKMTRDRIMRALDTRYPQYGFARHMGYGTKLHLEALAKWGVTPSHRLSFAPVRRYAEKRILEAV